MNKHARAIQEILVDIKPRGEFRRAEAVHLLLNTRKLLESTGIASTHPATKFYGDWCAHSTLKGAFAQEALLKITDVIAAAVKNAQDPAAVDSVICGISAALGVQLLRSELRLLHGRFGLDSWHLDDPRLFRQFMAAVLIEIEECPLRLPSQVEQESLRRANGDPVWRAKACEVTQKLSSEQLKFYNVPPGTFVWQVTLVNDAAMCGLLLI